METKDSEGYTIYVGDWDSDDEVTLSESDIHYDSEDIDWLIESISFYAMNSCTEWCDEKIETDRHNHINKTLEKLNDLNGYVDFKPLELFSSFSQKAESSFEIEL